MYFNGKKSCEFNKTSGIHKSLDEYRFNIAATPKIDSFIKVFITNSPSKMKNEALIISVIIHI